MMQSSQLLVTESESISCVCAYAEQPHGGLPYRKPYAY